MSVIMSKDGFRALRFASAVAIAAVGVAIFLIGGSYWYWQAETRNDVLSARSIQEARQRVEKTRQERDDLRDSAQNYRALTARGVFIAEQRLELIETMNALKDRHQMVDIQYEVQPQRPLRMLSGTAFPAVDVLGSRIKLKLNALHDGDLVAFLDEFPRLNRGLFPMDRCAIRRANEELRTAGDATSARELSLAGSRLIAECTLEWITLRDKRQALVTQTAGGSAL
jgi:hypothetical protein